VLAADLLQYILNKAKDMGLLRLPLAQHCGQDHPVIQYDDDRILVMEACLEKLFFLKAILNSFIESTGLHANYQKSNIYTINVPAEKMIILAKTFKCNIGTLLFTYLSLPMGTAKPNLSSFIPLIQKIEKWLSSTSMFLSLVGRLQMVNSVFSSLPTFSLCTLIIPKAIIA
jgi:hypothetical protein